MRTDPEPDEAGFTLRGQRPGFDPNASRPGIWPNGFEMQPGMFRVFPQQPVVLAGQLADGGGKPAIMLPEVRRGRMAYGSGVQRPAVNSAMACCASLSSGPPGRASSSICASQSSSHRRSKWAFNRHNSWRGNFSMAASISFTVLMAKNYRFHAPLSTLNP